MGYQLLEVEPGGLSSYFMVVGEDVTSPAISKGIYLPKQSLGEGKYAYITNLTYGSAGELHTFDSQLLIPQGTTAPTTTKAGDLWVDTSVANAGVTQIDNTPT